MKPLPKVLPEPKRPENIAANAQWLAGEGAGSWFVIAQLEGSIQVKRYAPNGDLECEGLFEVPSLFDATKTYKIDYPSHCAKVTIVQERRTMCFVRISGQ